MYLSFGADSWAASKMTEESLKPFTGKKNEKHNGWEGPSEGGRESQREPERARERGNEQLKRDRRVEDWVTH